MPKVGELPWSWILGDRAQVYKEKEQFVLVNYVSYKKPHRTTSRDYRAVMVKKFTQKSDACAKLSFCFLNLFLCSRYRSRRGCKSLSINVYRPPKNRNCHYKRVPIARSTFLQRSSKISEECAIFILSL